MKDVLVDPLQSRLFACNGYVQLGLDHCFIDLASNQLVSLECRTCQQISHIMGSNVELAKQLFWAMEKNNLSDILTLRDHCRWLLLPTAA